MECVRCRVCKVWSALGGGVYTRCGVRKVWSALGGVLGVQCVSVRCARCEV